MEPLGTSALTPRAHAATQASLNPEVAASPPQAGLPGRGHGPGGTEGRCHTFPVFAVTAGTPLRAGLAPPSVRRKGSDSDQSRLAPSQASGLCVSPGTTGISLGARWALAVATATAEGHEGPGEPLPPHRTAQTRGCHRPIGRLSPTLPPSDQGPEGSDLVSPTLGPPGLGRCLYADADGALNTPPPAGFLLALELKK